MLGARGGWAQSADDRGAGRRAHRGARPTVVVDAAAFCEPVDVGRCRVGVSATVQVWSDILPKQPQEIRAIRRGGAGDWRGGSGGSSLYEFATAHASPGQFGHDFLLLTEQALSVFYFSRLQFPSGQIIQAARQ